MSSHNIRINVEHYSNGGFGVIGEHYDEMGLQTLSDIRKAIERVMLMELGYLKLEEEKK